MNTDNFLIEEKDLELAQAICRPIDISEVKNRALANATAAIIASKYFEEAEVDTESGLHNIAPVLEDIDIADIYIKNCYIDVRVFFNEEEIAVPKAHFDNNLLPVAYMFIKVTPDLSGATVVGFIQPENIDTSKDFNGYYKIGEESLVSYYDIEIALCAVEDTYSISDKDIFAYLDNTIENKNKFYSELIASKDGRLRLAHAAKAQYIFNFVSVAQPAEEKTVVSDTSADENLDLDSDVGVLELEEDFGTLELDDSVSDEQVLDSQEDFSDSGIMLEEQQESMELNIDLAEDLPLAEEPVSEPEESAVSAGFSDFNPDEISLVQAPGIEHEAEAPESQEELFDNIEDIVEDAEEIAPAPVDNEVQSEETDDLTDDDLEFNELIQAQTEETPFESAETSFKEEYKTVASPSLDLYESLEQEEAEDNTAEQLAALEDDGNGETGSMTEDMQEESGESSDIDSSSTEEIETLFNNDSEEDASDSEFAAPKKSNSSLKLLLIVGLLAVLGALGYLGASKFLPSGDKSQNSIVQEPAVKPAEEAVSEPEAMPVETVEITETEQSSKNEGNAVSIPAIEQNLDASILVSNLKIDWEVPSGYASNSSARRYLVKLGKIIQLNLKTELLLLSKPPISNKIAVAIKFNPSSKKFETIGVTTSSGETSVDDLILKTVQKALAMKLNMNSDSFAKLKGNPTLIIRL